jgi:hypothetical protein
MKIVHASSHTLVIIERGEQRAEARTDGCFCFLQQAFRNDYCGARELKKSKSSKKSLFWWDVGLFNCGMLNDFEPENRLNSRSCRNSLQGPRPSFDSRT